MPCTHAREFEDTNLTSLSNSPAHGQTNCDSTSDPERVDTDDGRLLRKAPEDNVVTADCPLRLAGLDEVVQTLQCPHCFGGPIDGRVVEPCGFGDRAHGEELLQPNDVGVAVVGIIRETPWH
jgi:hypothetical protein